LPYLIGVVQSLFQRAPKFFPKFGSSYTTLGSFICLAILRRPGEVLRLLTTCCFMDEYGLIIVLALIGFIVVAALVLYPVYKFLLRQEEISRDWTEEKLAERLSKRKS